MSTTSIQQQQAEYLQSLGSEPVPAPYRYKYCLLFGSRLFGAYDTVEEMEQALEKAHHLSLACYYPPGAVVPHEEEQQSKGA